MITKYLGSGNLWLMEIVIQKILNLVIRNAIALHEKWLNHIFSWPYNLSGSMLCIQSVPHSSVSSQGLVPGPPQILESADAQVPDINWYNIYIYPMHILPYTLCIFITFKNFFLLIYFIYSLLCWVFIALHRLSLVALSGGFSCCRAQALGHTGWEVAACRFSSCGSRA